MRLTKGEQALIRLALIHLEVNPPEWVRDKGTQSDIKALTGKFTKEMRR